MMFGRRCNSIPLLKLKYYSTYPDENQSADDDSIYSDSTDDPFANDEGNVNDIGDEMARLNIKAEQARQKRIYDKKVKGNR